MSNNTVKTVDDVRINGEKPPILLEKFKLQRVLNKKQIQEIIVKQRQTPDPK